MIMEKNATEKLFSYGTLRYEPVQITTFGRKLYGVPDILKGYRLSTLQIKDVDVVAKSGNAVHPILIYTGNLEDEVKGTVFDISGQELQQADEYEVVEYKRVREQLNSGIFAWVYVSAN